jgi:low affinity Fe/Cu permease
MLLLGVSAFAFGLLAAPRFSTAPFVAGNIVAVVGVFVFGLLNGWSLGRILEGLAVTIVCLQAAFLLGTVRKAFTGGRNLPVRQDEGQPALQRDISTIDRTR